MWGIVFEVSPILSIVSIIPGIETGAPDLTDRRSGFYPPNIFPITPSVLDIFFLMLFFKTTDSDLAFK